MKRWSLAVFALILAITALPPCAPAAPASSQDQVVQQLLEEVKALKARVGELESKLAQTSQTAVQAGKKAEEAQAVSARSLKVSRTLEETKTAAAEQSRGLVSDLGKRIKVYGALEVNGYYQRKKSGRGATANESDIKLATAEIFFESEVNKYVKGLLHLLYEQDDTDPMNVDEGFIVVGQTDDIPAYLMAGRMYPAVGVFETYMVSDPITQNVFETQASAAEVGWRIPWLNASVGTFNSAVQETGRDSNINTYYTRLQLSTPEGSLGDLSLTGGVAYINNIAGSGGLRDEVADKSLNSLVGGWSVMASAYYKWLTLTTEYIAAVDDFKAGELGFANGASARPSAWNVELAVMPVKAWTFAARYEGSKDLFAYEPERQYGLTVSWGFLADTTLSLEYLRGDYADDGTRDLVTTQLAVGF